MERTSKNQIEIGRTSDIDELERLYDTLIDYLTQTINYPGWLKGVYPVRQTAEEGIAQGRLFVLRKKGVIAGSIVLNHRPEKAYHQAKWSVDGEINEALIVHTLVVHPQFMKQGIARSLLEFAKEFAHSLPVKAIRLDVSIHNTPAIALYEQLGFRYIETVDLGLPYAHLKWFRLYEFVL